MICCRNCFPSRLSWSNGIIELGTLLAAIMAALAGGFLTHIFRGRQEWSGIVFLSLSAIGLLTSLGINRVAAADSSCRFDWNWPGQLFDELRRMWRDPQLWMAVAANTFFWFLGALLLLNILLYATDILRVDETHSSYLLATLSLGIGFGSFLAGYASGRKIESGMILPGVAGITLMAALLARPGLGFQTVLICLALLGVTTGFLVVPVNALIQNPFKPEEKGRVIAAANLLSFGGVALQPWAQYAMLRLGHPDPASVFLVAAAGATFFVGLLLARMLPELWPRALLWTRLRHRSTL